MDKRIFYSDNSVLSDWSVALNNYHTGTKTFTLVAIEDAIYIGARFPFNHLYFKLNTANENASTMTISYWDSSTWREAVEVIDETEGFTKSGFVKFVPNKTYGWVKEDTNYAGSTVTGLTSVEIYDLYWLKITFSADMSESVISWCGNKFSDDNDLGSEYSDLVRASMISAFEAGKTDWEEQHIRAAKIIINDLVSKGIIIEKEQILDREDFKLAAVSKCAEIIYLGLGEDYRERANSAREEYRTRLNSAMPRIDKDKNAIEDDYDKLIQGSLYR